MNPYSVSKRLALFPVTAVIKSSAGSDRLEIAGCDLTELAAKYGTPLYLYDQATLDTTLDAYQQALAQSYGEQSGLTYAGQAFLCVAMAQWVQHRGLWLDCTGIGELLIAAVAGAKRGTILAHGANKSPAELAAALSLAGTIVVDNLSELKRLISLSRQAEDPLPDLWLRIQPGWAVATRLYAQSNQEDSKFGMNRGQVVEAIRICRRHDLSVTGLHFHQGSQLRDPAPIGPALDRMLDLMDILQTGSAWSPLVVCPGGGWGVAYHEEELPHPPIREYVSFVAGRLAYGCQQRRLPLPRLQLEPGRSLVARAGVALYRLGAVKRTAHRRWLMLDGGLADNPRPALYGARYSALPVAQPRRRHDSPAWLAGPGCESSDVLIEALPFPEVEPGELIAVPMSGAYQISMASNYSGACKPAVLWLEGGKAHLVQRREQMEDLIKRDRPVAILPS